MHERLLKQKSIDQHILTQFTGKTNQSYESFISQFDYKNDGNKKYLYFDLKRNIILNNKFKKTLFKLKSQMKLK